MVASEVLRLRVGGGGDACQCLARNAMFRIVREDAGVEAEERILEVWEWIMGKILENRKEGHELHEDPSFGIGVREAVQSVLG